MQHIFVRTDPLILYTVCMITRRHPHDYNFFINFSLSRGRTITASRQPTTTHLTKSVEVFCLLQASTMKAPACKNGCITSKGLPSRHQENRCPLLRKKVISKMDFMNMNFFGYTHCRWIGCSTIHSEPANDCDTNSTTEFRGKSRTPFSSLVRWIN